MKHLRYWLAIASVLLLAHAALAYAQHFDAESARRDLAAIERGGP